VGLGVDGEVFDATVLPNGDLVVVGEFARAAGVSVGGIARWGCACLADYTASA